jgi:hypothetical protein
MVRLRFTSAVLVGLVPVLALGTTASGLTARRAASVRSAASLITVGKHYGLAGNASGYSAIVVTGKHAAWVFGGTNPGGPSTPVAASWDGRILRPSALPVGLTGFISAASASSPSNVWAVSDYGPYALRWNGRTWQVAKRWGQGLITGLVAISPRDVWVFGTTSSGTQGIGTWHFDGRSWTAVNGQAGDIYQASAWRRDIWAIAAANGGYQIERYDGRSWQRVRTGRALSGLTLSSVVAVSDRDVWLLGNTTGKAGPGPLVLVHWNGYRWRRLTTRLQAWAGQLAPGSSGGVLATAAPASSLTSGLILQVSTAGRLSTTTVTSALGSGVSDVALARDSRYVWATGGVLTPLGGNAALWLVPVPRASASYADLDRD